MGNFIIGVIHYSFLLMIWISILFLPIFIPEIDVSYREALPLICILFTVGSCGFMIYYLDGTKLTPVRNVRYHGGLYFNLIGGYLGYLFVIIQIWFINIYFSLLSLFFLLGHLISLIFLWNMVLKKATKKYKAQVNEINAKQGLGLH